MHIYIDESGIFSGPRDQHSVSVVGALIIPDDRLARVAEKYAKIRPDLPKEDGEVKGRLLQEREVDRVVSMLTRHQTLFEITAIDAVLHDHATIETQETHKREQAKRITIQITDEHHPNVRAGLFELRRRLERMTDQLYLQSVVTFHLIASVIQNSTLFFAQRKPKELSAFHWVIDGKDKVITDWESWWSLVVMPILQSKSMREPMAMLDVADYAHFERFSTTVREHLRPHVPERANDDATDIGKVLRESFRFSSDPEPGLEMVDILTNATRRALMNRLGIKGWRNIPRLMIERPRHYIDFVMLSNSPPSRRRWPYMSVLHAFGRGGKSMLAPRFLTPQS